MAEHGEILEAGAIRFQRLLPAPIERVWAYLTEPELRAKWFASGPMDLHPGGKIELRFRNSGLSPDPEPVPEPYRAYEDILTVGRVTGCDPPRFLSHSWSDEMGGGESEVSYELEDRQGRTLLTLTHRRVAPEEMVSAASGWHTHLGILEDLLDERSPRPFWSTHAALEEEYRERVLMS
jgi:uncharacterized protein YndB with AHSA1/START domain